MTDRTVSFRILSDGKPLADPPSMVPTPDIHWRNCYFDKATADGTTPSESDDAATTVAEGTTASIPAVFISTDANEQYHPHFSNLGDKGTRHNLWATKALMDPIPEKIYYLARNSTFPLAVGGSQGARTFENRAGHKLNEVMEVTGIWNNFVKGAGLKPADAVAEAAPAASTANGGSSSSDAAPLPQKGGSNKLNTSGRTAFIDLCGGPGSFAQAIFGAYPRRSKAKLVGFGMTLKDPNMQDKHNTAMDGWYPNLVANKNFHPTFGVNGEGDIYKMSNIHAMVSTTEGMPMLLAVADGGFEVPSCDANYQETISMRLAFAQWHSAMCVLQKGGAFVLKLFDTFSPIMRSMLYLTTKFFDSTFIVKPKHSRAVNSERYLAAKGFRGLQSQKWKQYLQQVHEQAFSDSSMPFSLIPSEWMQLENDAAFEPSMVAMNKAIAENQMEAIQKVMNSSIIQRHLLGEAYVDPNVPAVTSEETSEGAESAALGEKRPREGEDDVTDVRRGAEAAAGEEELFVTFE